MREQVKEGYEDGDWPEQLGGDRDLREYEREMLSSLIERVPDEPSLLDLGCGTGLPFDRWLVKHDCSITGVDIVKENLEHAREHLPDQEFINADFSTLDYEDAFDAVVSFYAIFHIPREEHAQLFQDISSWLKRGGAILLTISPEPMERYEDDFLGGEIVWSAWGPEKTKQLLREAGFTIENEYEEDREDDGEHHLWILATV